MSLHFDLAAVALCLVAGANLLLSFLVLRASPQREENRLFALVSAFVALWAFTNGFFRIASVLEAATLSAQLSYSTGLCIAASFLHFSWVYPRKSHVPVKAKTGTWLLAVAISALAFVPNFMVSGVLVEQRRIVTAPGIYLLAGYMVFASGAAFSVFIRNQTRLRGRAQAQARYVLYGSALTAGPGLFFNLLLPLFGNYRWVWLGPVASLFFVGCCAYSIIAHRLFDVRLLIRRTVVYTLLLSVMAGVFPAVEQVLQHVLRPLLGTQDNLATSMVAALIIGMAVEPVKRRLHQVTDKMFESELPHSVY